MNNPFTRNDGSTAHWWQTEVPPLIVLTLCLLGILLYWSVGLLEVYGIINVTSWKVAVILYYVHWSSVGGLIQFALSKKNRVLLGAIMGLILSQLLML